MTQSNRKSDGTSDRNAPMGNHVAGATLVILFDLLLGTAALALVALDSATTRILSPLAAGACTALALATVTFACAIAFGLWREQTGWLVAAAAFYAVQVAGVLLAATGAAVYVIVAKPRHPTNLQQVDDNTQIEQADGLLSIVNPWWLVPTAAFATILYSGISVWRLLAVLAARRHISDEFRATAERAFKNLAGEPDLAGGVYFVPGSVSGYCTPVAAAYADYCSMPYSRPPSSISMNSRYTMQPNMNTMGMGNYACASNYGYYISPYPNVGRMRHSYA